jgi:hypothetical protein
VLRDEVWDVLDRRTVCAQARFVSMLELAIGGIVAMPGGGIVGASTPDHARARQSTPEQAPASAAVREWTPTAEDLEQLRALPWSTRSDRLA